MQCSGEGNAGIVANVVSTNAVAKINSKLNENQQLPKEHQMQRPEGI